jgi:hypothetical protein
MGASGIASVNCDYLTSDRNLVYHSGYEQGWTSGISYNGSGFYDSYAGLHNIISNNIIAGEYDGSSNHTDGNGIIMDLSFNRTSGITNANTPPGLIINNVVYQNGGRCIQNYTVTNIWVVNNTCYKNNLDTSVGGGTAGGIVDKASKNDWYVNNIVYSWQSKNPAYKVESSSTGIHWYRNMYYVGGLSGFTPPSGQFISANPLFMAPPSVNSTALGQYQSAIDPKTLGNALELQGGSSAMNKGVDPATLSNVPSAVLNDLKKYLYKDIRGASRTAGSSFDLGAYSY